jgi:pimeloyl-ACP methyl ester carboxylesterase
MWGRTFFVAVVVALLGPAPGALAQSSGDTTGYCTPDGGPQGQATDAEHTVLLGDPPLPAGVRESRVAAGGISTRVLQAGPATATDAVVFLHGSPNNARDWDDLMAASGGFARAVAFDIPGYGKSDKADPPELNTTDGAAGYIQGVLDRLGVRRAVLVVHDFGGIWGLQWAVQHKASLRGAVLIDGGVLIDYTPHPDALAFSTPGVGEQTMASTTRQTFVGQIKQQNPLMPEDYLNRLYDDYDRPMRCAVLRYYRSSAETFQTLGRDQAAALKPLDLPALVLWGEKDPYVPVDQAERQKEAFPHARIVTYPESGHWPHIDNPDAVRSDAVGFLRPSIAYGRPRGSARGRRVKVPVRIDGVLPVYHLGVRITLGRHREGASRRLRVVSGGRSLSVRVRRPLRAGRYVAEISASGLPRRRVSFRVR